MTKDDIECEIKAIKTDGELMIKYLYLKASDADWQGVKMAANDLLMAEAEIRALERALKMIEENK